MPRPDLPNVTVVVSSTRHLDSVPPELVELVQARDLVCALSLRLGEQVRVLVERLDVLAAQVCPTA